MIEMANAQAGRWTTTASMILYIALIFELHLVTVASTDATTTTAAATSTS